MKSNCSTIKTACGKSSQQNQRQSNLKHAALHLPTATQGTWETKGSNEIMILCLLCFPEIAHNNRQHAGMTQLSKTTCSTMKGAAHIHAPHDLLVL